MYKWIPCLALAVIGCGGGSGLEGTWKGDAAGWSVTVVLNESVEQNGTAVYSGTVSSNKSTCFNNGTAVGTLVNESSATVSSSASGSASSTTILEITGEVSGDKLTGYLEAVSSNTAECDLDRTAITLTRQ
ncbi:hypothetical protein F0U60_04040 [Archangium minus]|uniref:Lipoprotein n=1 Tax=Archangium minus TaxID=83450 RepID=A0ABY9WQW2_9BACT|nr:hypothetical protein F0U60_04040 [Archangium minus]